MDTSTIVNIILCILSFLLALISVCTVVITLHQNHQMIVNSTRPYLSIYHSSTYFDTMRHYLILKNFGASSATIVEFSCNCDTSEFAVDENLVPFDSLSGVSLAPGQKILYAIDSKKFSTLESITFTLKYQSDSRQLYCETFEILPKYLHNVCGLRASTKNKEMQIISFSLQDIAEKML